MRLARPGLGQELDGVVRDLVVLMQSILPKWHLVKVFLEVNLECFASFLRQFLKVNFNFIFGLRSCFILFGAVGIRSRC